MLPAVQFVSPECNTTPSFVFLLEFVHNYLPVPVPAKCVSKVGGGWSADLQIEGEDRANCPWITR